MKRSPVSWTVGLGCCAALLAACSSSSSGTPQSPPDKSALTKMQLTAADLPAGWAGKAQTSSSAGDATGAKLFACIGAKNTDPDRVADIDSKLFSKDSASISSSASSYHSQSDIDSDIAVIKSPKLVPCFDRLVKTSLGASLPAGATITSTDFTPTTGANGGPGNVVGTLEGTIGVAVQGRTLKLYLGVVFITGPLTEAQVTYENLGSPVDSGVLKSAVAAVAGRAQG